MFIHRYGDRHQIIGILEHRYFQRYGFTHERNNCTEGISVMSQAFPCSARHEPPLDERNTSVDVLPNLSET